MMYNIFKYLLIILFICSCEGDENKKTRWIKCEWCTEFMIVPGGYIVKFTGTYNSSMVYIVGNIPEEWKYIK